MARNKSIAYYRMLFFIIFILYEFISRIKLSSGMKRGKEKRSKGRMIDDRRAFQRVRLSILRGR